MASVLGVTLVHRKAKLEAGEEIPWVLPSHLGDQDPCLQVEHPKYHPEELHLHGFLTTHCYQQTDPRISHLAAACGHCWRWSGVESGRSCRQPKKLGPTVVPREKEGICNPNMGSWGEPDRSIGRRWLPQALPPTTRTGSACARRNLSINGRYSHSIGPLADMSWKWGNAALKVLEYSAIGCWNEETRGVEIREWKCQNKGVGVCLY